MDPMIAIQVLLLTMCESGGLALLIYIDVDVGDWHAAFPHNYVYTVQGKF